MAELNQQFITQVKSQTMDSRTERPSAYIPRDRRQALYEGVSMPDRVSGAALFADISGFTPLTENLLQDLGPQRGAEELTRQLNLVYDALIAELHRFGGSVISFSGDAITCWLDGDDGFRATACAFAMQVAMEQFSQITTPSGKTISLAMKTAVAAGSARRFLIGNPHIQLIDALAGSLLDELAAGEKCAHKGEVVLNEAVLHTLGDAVSVTRWCSGGGNGRFGIIEPITQSVFQTPWPELPPHSIPEEEVRKWLLPAIFERLSSGRGEFLAELRPAVALFLRFSGIDYDQDADAADKLDKFIQAVQAILAKYESNLLQLTIGDKGSNLYAAFGAPLAHEDDAIRAVSAALELTELSEQLDYINAVEIGISQGRLRTGAYGGSMRRTYGVLGDDVNLAARLMQLAQPGEILVSERVWSAAKDAFTWESRPDAIIKGKSEPVPVYKVEDHFQPATIRLQEPSYTLPMVGREKEIAQIEAAFQPLLQGKGQILHISGEAGIGKSRLVSEIVHRATELKINGFGGECQSYGTKSSYLVWQRIWQGFFNLPTEQSKEEQLRHLEQELTQIDPAFAARMPVLSPVINLQIPDNDLTQSFDAKLRKSSLESMLVDCLRANTKNSPLLLVLEDCHWIDPLSLELLDVLGRGIADRPVLLVIVTRALQAEKSQGLPITQLPYYTNIHLSEFTPAEAKQLIKLKLAHFFGTEQRIPVAFVDSIISRAEGNPFYIEELLNYLGSQGIEPRNMHRLNQIELPASLHSLILSRIDQLTESQKSTLKVASVIGRLFKAAMLWGAYPQLGERENIKRDLEELQRLDLTPMDSPEPELTYLFKNIITQEVAYESLPYATRAMFHDLIGEFIERTSKESLNQAVDLLAYHFERTNNEAKKREYLLKAGEAAQANYANKTALEYFERLLPLLSYTEQIPVKLKLGQVLELVGQWDDALNVYTEAQLQAETLDNRQAVGECQTALGELYRKRGMYEEAGFWLKQAQTNFEGLNDKVGIGQALHFAGSLAAQQGDLETARIRYEASLALRRELNDAPHIAGLLSNLGIVARYQGDYAKARALHEEGLAIRRELGDRRAIAVSLNNLGNVALDQVDYEEARTRLEEAVLLQREVGDKAYIANSLNNLGNVVRAQGDYEAANQYYLESLQLLQELGDKWSLAYLLQDMGCLAALEKNGLRAYRLIGAATRLRENIGAPLTEVEEEKYNKLLTPLNQEISDIEREQWLSEGLQLPLDAAIEFAFSR